MAFWIIAGVLAAFAAAALLRPLLRQVEETLPRAAYDMGVYRDQLTEIERDVERGVLNPDQATAARTEIERRMLAATDSNPEIPIPPKGGASRLLAVAILLFLPLMGGGLYLLLGSPGLPSLPFAERPPPPEPAARDQAAAAQMSELIVRLTQRLAENPDDRDGWLLLGRSHAELGQFDKAVESYRQAIAQGFGDAETQSALGEVLTAANGGAVVPEARQAFAAALEQDPADPRARYYAGLALAQEDRLQDAIGVWTSLLRQSPPDAPWRPIVEEQITQASKTLGIAPPAIPSGPPDMPSTADRQAVEDMTAEGQAAFIRSMVERLATRLEEQPDDFDGWLRLARAYAVLGERDQAETALERAAGLIRDLPADAPERTALKETKTAIIPAE